MWRLDLHGSATLEKEADKLAGKLGTATGDYFVRKGVEVKFRHIVVVKTLSP